MHGRDCGRGGHGEYKNGASDLIGGETHGHCKGESLCSHTVIMWYSDGGSCKELPMGRLNVSDDKNGKWVMRDP